MDDFPHVYPAYTAGFSRLMILLRQECGGDLDMALILAVIGERHFARRVRTEAPTYETLGHTETDGTPSVNAYSVAQYTGIPRETARRKVAALVERGWVVSDARGNLSPTAKAAEDLVRATDEALELIALLRAGDRRRDVASPTAARHRAAGPAHRAPPARSLERWPAAARRMPAEAASRGPGSIPPDRGHDDPE